MLNITQKESNVGTNIIMFKSFYKILNVFKKITVWREIKNVQRMEIQNTIYV